MSAPKVVRVGLVKLGNIGSAPLLEFLLDERAERYDITVKVVGSGAKIAVGDSEEIVSQILSFKPDLAVVVSPNAGLPGPTKVRNLLSNSRVQIIVVSDGPTKKSVKTPEENGFGYLIVEADSMIDARREFLDPTEMALFNAHAARIKYNRPQPTPRDEDASPRLTFAKRYDSLCDGLTQTS